MSSVWNALRIFTTLRKERVVRRTAAARAVVVKGLILRPEERIAVEQAVVHRPLQDVLRDLGAQPGVLIPQIPIIVRPLRIA